MARGEETLKKPVISPERDKDIMTSTPARSEKALSEEKAKRRHE